MISLAWNCRGLGSDSAIQDLQDLVRATKPQFLFLCETRLSTPTCTNNLRSLGFPFVICVDSANSDYRSRDEEYAFLSAQLHLLDGPYMICGDFNDIMALSEKRGGLLPPPARLARLTSFVDSHGLVDLGFEGPPFTWSNHQVDPDEIEERLDRYLVIPTWLDIWPEAKVRHLLPLSSDHRPIYLTTSIPSPITKRLFRFDCRWADNPEVAGLVAHYWSLDIPPGSLMFRLHHKLKNIRHALFDSSRASTSNSARLIHDLTDARRVAVQQLPVNWPENQKRVL
ncbi:hypothetical protein LINGRAHAP2_LOCUS22874 [Linum grandiflorum]